MIKRSIIAKIKPWIGEKKIIIIKGARQVGKTTLLRYLKEGMEKEGEKTVYLAVDQEYNSDIFKEPKLFLQFLKDQHELGSQKKVFVFLDEFQYIKEAGRFLKVIFDISGDSLQLIVSGSSSLEITKNSEYLTGRKIDFILSTLSFGEYLNAHSEYKYPRIFSLNDMEGIVNFYNLYKNDLQNHLVFYLYWGGYPEISGLKEEGKKKQVLGEIISTYIEKDVASFLHVEQVGAFNNLIKILSSQIGQLVNHQELGATLGLHQQTLRKYLDILEGTFVFSLIKPYFTNVRKELSKMPKVYVHDFGVISYLLNVKMPANFSLLDGKLVENFIFNELCHQGFESINFYRTMAKAEIDFIINMNGKLTPLEVKFRKGQRTVPVSINNFARYYQQKAGRPIIITQDDLFFSKEAIFLPAVLLPFVKLA